MTRFKYYFVTFLDVRFGRLDFKAFAAPRTRPLRGLRQRGPAAAP